MKIATVTLRHKKKNKTIIVDQKEYAEDLGKHKYREYELVGAQHNDDESAKISVTTQPVKIGAVLVVGENGAITEENAEKLIQDIFNVLMEQNIPIEVKDGETNLEIFNKMIALDGVDIQIPDQNGHIIETSNMVDVLTNLESKTIPENEVHDLTNNESTEESEPAVAGADDSSEEVTSADHAAAPKTGGDVNGVTGTEEERGKNKADEKPAATSRPAKKKTSKKKTAKKTS